jgi:hypothetical protein
MNHFLFCRRKGKLKKYISKYMKEKIRLKYYFSILNG